jgi:hypothetical protein
MSKYEAKLKSGSLFDNGFPEIAFAVQKIAPSLSVPALPTTDKNLIQTLLKEYHTYLEYIKDRFTEYEANVERWYISL